MRAVLRQLPLGRRASFAAAVLQEVSLASSPATPSSASACRRLCSSAAAEEEGEDHFVFVVRTRRGLEPLLRQELAGLRALQDAGATGLSLGATERRSAESLAVPEAREAEGAVEVYGPWPVLYSVLLGSRLAQSVWVRVGNVFRCEEAGALAQAAREAPWGQLLPVSRLASLHVSASERESRLSASQAVAAVGEVFRGFVPDSAAPDRPSRDLGRRRWSPQDLGLRVVLDADLCSLELNCGSRLGVRPFLSDRTADLAVAGKAPFAAAPSQSLAKGTSQGKATPSKGIPGWSLRAENKVPELQAAEPIGAEWRGKDVDSAYAAALARHLPLRKLLAQDSGLVIWDPFCRNGGLLLETLSVALGLPASGCPVPSSFRTASSQQVKPQPLPEEARLKLGMSRSCCTASAGAMPEASHIVRATSSASRRVRRRPRQETVDEAEPSAAKAKASEAKADADRKLLSFSSSRNADWGSSLPCEVSLNVASFEAVGPYISGALVVTRVPNEVRALGPTARVARLYRQFGHFLASRKDWSGVYVLTESSVFRRQSKLAWQVLLRFTDHTGQKCQLLHWSSDRPHGHRARVQAAPETEGQPHSSPSGKGVAWERAPRRSTVGRQGRQRPGRPQRPR
ncbi:unnamed protein product [Polarella glacialis]|uniref:Uncharacterized protein n=1 Tax=Polarella glacialis TaxID=89957 RepID=A0A813J781_POLGL|nr:unnamed protein product [Polarella glacialis]